MKTQQSRRDFLRITAAGTIGALILRSEAMNAAAFQSPFNKNTPIGLQLYTIRDDMKKDPRGSLKKVSDLGYKLLELADYADGKFYGFAPAEFKKIVDDLGMQVLSSHINVESASNKPEDAERIAADHAKLGAKYAIQPWVEAKDRNIAFFENMVKQLNEAGAKMKKSGIKFGYHNHNFEFNKIDGKIPYYDIILPGTDKDLVTLELDLFWTTKAGQNPIEIFKKYPGRFELFHMKDMFTKQAPFFDTVGVDDFAPVGAGIMDFKSILAEGKTAGVKYLIVEQDSTKDNKPFDAIKTSITNLKTKILV
jgi:sugar phosphate isomerase/epimerase